MVKQNAYIPGLAGNPPARKAEIILGGSGAAAARAIGLDDRRKWHYYAKVRESFPKDLADKIEKLTKGAVKSKELQQGAWGYQYVEKPRLAG